jgi:hypothetical protein
MEVYRDVCVWLMFFSSTPLFGLNVFFVKFPEEIHFRSGFQDEIPTSYPWNTLEWLVKEKNPFSSASGNIF